jgi:hypothetical protein
MPNCFCCASRPPACSESVPESPMHPPPIVPGPGQAGAACSLALWRNSREGGGKGTRRVDEHYQRLDYTMERFQHDLGSLGL